MRKSKIKNEIDKKNNQILKKIILNEYNQCKIKQK